MKEITLEPWTYVLEHGVLLNGEPRRVWLQQDGLGKWLVTKDFNLSPPRYLTIDGTWSERATPDTRHGEHTARSLAIGYLVRKHAEDVADA